MITSLTSQSAKNVSQQHELTCYYHNKQGYQVPSFLSNELNRRPLFLKGQCLIFSQVQLAH
jgi:hypothetical protein